MVLGILFGRIGVEPIQPVSDFAWDELLNEAFVVLVYILCHGVVSLKRNPGNILDQYRIVILSNFPVLEQLVQLLELHSAITEKYYRKQGKYKRKYVVELEVMLILKCILVGRWKDAELMIDADSVNFTAVTWAVVAKTVCVDVVDVQYQKP